MNRRGRDRSNREVGVCFDFQTNGKCTRNQCRFRHVKNGDATKGSSQSKRPVRVSETPAQQQARKVYNEWMRLLGTRNDANDTNIMRRVWQGAFDILQAGDRDWIQQLPVDLDSDDDIRNGRQHLQAILNAHIQRSDHTTFIMNCRYFLLTLTHHRLVSSLAVDTYVGSIYNFVSGVNGVKAVTFFNRLCKAIVQVTTDNHHGVAMDTLESTLQLMPTALKELLRRERRARLQDGLPSLLEALDTAAVPFTPATSALVKKRTSDMRAMIARANGLLADGEEIQEATPTSSYPRNLVVPSGRHDNDKLDITEITIFPTLEEILTDVEEFLPFTDYDQPHFLSDPRQRHIDTYFRLLRHDMFSDLKEALAGLINMATRSGGALQDSKLSLRDIKANHYSQSVISDVEFSDRQGLYASMTFLQPRSVQQKSARHQKEWWDDAGRFQRGTLLSFLWQTQSIVQHMFLTCLEIDLRQFILQDEIGEPFATVKVQLTTNDEVNLRKLMEASLTGVRGILLEFPRIIPATFTPILENLQAIQRLGQFPFHEWIIPERQEACLHAKVAQDVPPPLYTRAADFSFPLNSIAREALSVNPTDSCDDKELLNKIENCTSLDRGQCHALVAALTRELAFIQGPPGTGKSYIGLQLVKVLLGVRKNAQLGPILIVSYTNHALDQFLEHLIKTDVREVIRIGSQSQSTLIQKHNLRHVGQEECKTRAENWLVCEKYRDISDHTKDATSILRTLRGFRGTAEWSVLEAHLTTRYPEIAVQFPRVDEDGYELVGQHPFDSWRSADTSGTRPNRDVVQVEQAPDLKHLLDKARRNVHSLSYVERQHLLYHWVRELHDDEVDGLFQIVHRAADTSKELANIHSETDLRVLQQAKVIGITTSGLAARITLLKKLRCKVIICEEAGEILEPHMVSALLPSVEHCIQIGDHQQLRPSVNNFNDLSLESHRGQLHQLDRSQFERLVVGEPGRPVMPVAQLNVQRRMRPEISTLIRETVYGKLVDHESTTNLPDVVGLRHNFYWLDHDNLECTPGFDARNLKSKSNDWEVMFVHALVRHVVRQGVYKSSDIAVLTPYTGQLQKLRTAMYNDFEIVLSDRDREALEKDGFEADGQLSDEAEEDDTTGPRKTSATDAQSHRRKPLRKKQLGKLLRLATVDNFQGEEAKVVIISLVRSNKGRKVGFLRTSNRINVLLSRAQHGICLIGNVDTYSNVDMWRKVIELLQAKDAVGKSLQLQCLRHPDRLIEVQQPEDFARFSPEGGCRKSCADRLECGHPCEAKCHSQAMHEVFHCEQPCQRRHKACNHLCTKRTCGEDCGKCEIKINSVQLPCGHSKDYVPCNKTLDLMNIHCDVKVSKEVPGCKHVLIAKCGLDVSSKGFRCPEPCKELLPCGHKCMGSCGSCKQTKSDGASVIKHKVCVKVCGRKHGTCNHNCGRSCHDGTDCGLCQQPCNIQCKHSSCKLKCHEPCAPCIEPCVWSCEHQGACTMPCSAPCNKLPCDERCTKLLRCGHQCPGLCGETCPVGYCQQCGEKQTEVPDLLMMQTYPQVDLNETPIVVLTCKHFFTAETLDGVIGMKDVYELDPLTGHFVGLREDSKLAAAVPQCPTCRKPISQYVTQRYNRLINRAVIDEMSTRFFANGQQELQRLSDRLTAIAPGLESLPDEIEHDLTPPTNSRLVENEVKKVNNCIRDRYVASEKLRSDISSFLRRVDEQNQPAHRLYEATLYATAKQLSLTESFTNLKLDDSSAAASLKVQYDQSVLLAGQVLLLKLSLLILEDKLNVRRAFKSKFPASTVPPAFHDGTPVRLIRPFLEKCIDIRQKCKDENLPKLAVETTLLYAHVTRLRCTVSVGKKDKMAKVNEYRKSAEALLKEAGQLCRVNFKGADDLTKAIEDALHLLSKEFYQEVTKEEVEAIKKAMLNGPMGLATHSGHWYKCQNGHPFAIGECGMPMEQARCPQCNAPIGGTNHQAVDGVTRAMEMED